LPDEKSKNAYTELQERDLYILTEFFKLLGNPTRIHILFLLIEQDADISLSLLKANKLVRQRRNRKMIFYTLVDDHVRMVIEKGTEHVLF